MLEKDVDQKPITAIKPNFAKQAFNQQPGPLVWQKT